MELAIYICLYLVVSFIIASVSAYYDTNVSTDSSMFLFIMLAWPGILVMIGPAYLLCKWLDFLDNKKAQQWKKKRDA